MFIGEFNDCPFWIAFLANVRNSKSFREKKYTTCSKCITVCITLWYFTIMLCYPIPWFECFFSTLSPVVLEQLKTLCRTREWFLLTSAELSEATNRKTEDEKKLPWATSGCLLIARYRLYSPPPSTTHWGYMGMSKNQVPLSKTSILETICWSMVSNGS